VIGAAAVAAAGLAGCAADRRAATTRSSATSLPTIPTSALPSAPTSESDLDIATAALRDEQRALATYQAVGRSFPRVRTVIEPVIAVQRRHVQTLAEALQSNRPPSPPVNLPLTSPDQIVVSAATHAARKRLHDCAQVESGSLASLLASMAAAHRVAAAVAAEWADQ
jgi:rubrerythrin